MEAMTMTNTKIEAENLKKHFSVDTGLSSLFKFGELDMVKAVDGVSFEVKEGESFGIAGESGCGKTTAGKTLIQLLKPTEGEIYYEGDHVTSLSGRELKQFRQEAQIIYQDPYESLNPRFTVFDWVKEPLEVHGIGTKQERAERVYQTLHDVNLQPPMAYADEYPSDLSGGERQRVAIARALVLNPSFIMADEPASMLDVSIRARLLDLFKQLQTEFDLTTVYISHDLSLLKYMCDRIAIMYLGRIVEVGTTERIINNPQHPYTQALVSSVPSIDPDHDKEIIEVPGEVPDPVDLPPGCRFEPRCPEATEECKIEEPPMYRSDQRDVRCILYED